MEQSEQKRRRDRWKAAKRSWWTLEKEALAFLDKLDGGGEIDEEVKRSSKSAWRLDQPSAGLLHSDVPSHNAATFPLGQCSLKMVKQGYNVVLSHTPFTPLEFMNGDLKMGFN